MPMVAKQKPYTLFIVDDDYPENPREDRENAGKMVCWHKRYNLGDEHDYEEPIEFLKGILCDAYLSHPDTGYGKPVFDYIRQGKAKDARLSYSLTLQEWELYENNFWSTKNDWYQVSAFPSSLEVNDIPDGFLEDCLAVLNLNELLELIHDMKDMVILPLYLYDHSGITMNTTGFSCPWDSGQVGWIYADAGMIKNAYGTITPDTMKKAKELLEHEVKEYDYYLTGQCYGFKLFEGNVEIDSCWGFIGEISDVSKEIKGYLPNGYKNMADYLEYHAETDEKTYLKQDMYIETECEDSMEA